jgi:hypothetical protein
MPYKAIAFNVRGVTFFIMKRWVYYLKASCMNIRYIIQLVAIGNFS